MGCSSLKTTKVKRFRAKVCRTIPRTKKIIRLSLNYSETKTQSYVHQKPNLCPLITQYPSQTYTYRYISAGDDDLVKIPHSCFVPVFRYTRWQKRGQHLLELVQWPSENTGRSPCRCRCCRLVDRGWWSIYLDRSVLKRELSSAFCTRMPIWYGLPKVLIICWDEQRILSGCFNFLWDLVQFTEKWVIGRMLDCVFEKQFVPLVGNTGDFEFLAKISKSNN